MHDEMKEKIEEILNSGYEIIPDPDYLIKTYSDMSDEQKKEYAEWLKTRPPHIQEACEKTPPYLDYTLTTTGKRARLYSIDEGQDGTVTFTILTHNNAFGLVKVFGITPDLLEPIIAEKSS